ncbi:MAG TPA: hypothetical protein VGD08_20290 [Stellaceae bacterium]
MAQGPRGKCWRPAADCTASPIHTHACAPGKPGGVPGHRRKTVSAGAALLANEAKARDFIADAFAHLKFIAYVGTALPLLQKAGAAEEPDAGMIELKGPNDATAFVRACRSLRFWDRAAKVKQF